MSRVAIPTHDQAQHWANEAAEAIAILTTEKQIDDFAETVRARHDAVRRLDARLAEEIDDYLTSQRAHIQENPP